MSRMALAVALFSVLVVATAPQLDAQEKAPEPVCRTCLDTARVPCERCKGGKPKPGPCEPCAGKGRVKCLTCLKGNPGRRTCHECSGKGSIDVTCWVCEGKGVADCQPCGMRGALACRRCDRTGNVLDTRRNVYVRCSDCDGAGWNVCQACKGQRRVECPVKRARECAKIENCPDCKAKGSQPCLTCGGKGKIDATCSGCDGRRVVACGACAPPSLFNVLSELCEKDLTTLQIEERQKQAAAKRVTAALVVSDVTSDGDAIVLSGAVGRWTVKCRFPASAKADLVKLGKGRTCNVVGLVAAIATEGATLEGCELKAPGTTGR